MKTIIKILCVLTLVFGLSSCGYERIDAGYEGIKVNLYGDGKGVDDVSLVTGAMLEEHSLENLKFLKKDILMLSTRLWFVML